MYRFNISLHTSNNNSYIEFQTEQHSEACWRTPPTPYPETKKLQALLNSRCGDELGNMGSGLRDELRFQNNRTAAIWLYVC